MKFTMTIELQPDQTVTSTLTIDGPTAGPLSPTTVHQIESAMRSLKDQVVTAAQRDGVAIKEPAKDGLARTGPVHLW